MISNFQEPSWDVGNEQDDGFFVLPDSENASAQDQGSELPPLAMVYSFFNPGVVGFSREREEMILNFEGPNLNVANEEDKDFFFPLDSGIPNFLLIKLFSDMDNKMKRLAIKYGQTPPPKATSSNLDRCTCACFPDAATFEHCLFCWNNFMDWSIIRRLAPKFKEGQAKEFEDAVVSSDSFERSVEKLRFDKFERMCMLNLGHLLSQRRRKRQSSTNVFERPKEEVAQPVEVNALHDYAEMFSWTYLMTVEVAAQEFQKEKEKAHDRKMEPIEMQGLQDEYQSINAHHTGLLHLDKP